MERWLLQQSSQFSDCSAAHSAMAAGSGDGPGARQDLEAPVERTDSGPAAANGDQVIVGSRKS